MLHLSKTSAGGAWAMRQMQELVRRGVECHVVLPDATGICDRYRTAGVTVHFMDLNVVPLTPAFFAAGRRLRALVRELRPELVHSHFVSTTLLMRYALRRESCTRVFQVPGPLHLENPASARLELWSATAEDVWIASCEWTRKRYLALGVPRERIFLSHYGLDLSETVPAAPGALRRELAVGSSTALVAMVAYCYKPKSYIGHARGIKGHEDFIDAIAILRRNGADVLGVIVGGAWVGGDAYYDSVRRYAARTDAAGTVFLGTRRDIAAIYADAAVAVHPSLSENLGGAAESLLYGVPTVTTTVGGFPDLITDRVTGLTVPPRTPGELARAIAELINDREAALRMAAAGRAHAAALLDVRTTAGAVFDIYGQLASRRESTGCDLMTTNFARS